MKISLVINADTRTKCTLPMTTTLDSNGGCSCVDFMTDGVLNKIKFFRGIKAELEIILFVDTSSGKIPDEIEQKVSDICYEYNINLILYTMDRGNPLYPKKYDMVYIEALCSATGDYVAHFDGDMGAFRSDDSNILERYLYWLNSNSYEFVSLPMIGSPNAGFESRDYWWASTRFFIGKRDYFNRDEMIRCFNNNYVLNKYGVAVWPNCVEHVLGARAGKGRVLYPVVEFDNSMQNPILRESGYMIFSWATYYKGTMEKLNSMTYSQVYNYIINECGGIHGANDVIGKELK